MEWLRLVEEFGKLAEDRLSRGEYYELEGVETPSMTPHPRMQVRLLEIPGIYRVAERYSANTELRYFMDGVQRTVLWRYYDYHSARIPVFLHLSGAVVLERVKPGVFLPVDQGYRSALLVPEFLHEELQGIDGVVSTGEAEPWNIAEAVALAKVKSRALRQALELEVMHRFLERHDALLVKDGNIIDTGSARVVGVVKSHSRLYLQQVSPTLQRLVWNMPLYHRSSAFSLRLSDGSRVESFYLRIHEPLAPETGLIRVEHRLSEFEELASWLIAESRVYSRGERWHSMLYPIQRCEAYLRTQLPGRRRLRALLEAVA
ncbi:MAG: hypothetical protein GXO66_08270 [Euryarchaeota archaeon]|nr:hypothetical protein [Euryarchaeota archaeon]